MLKVVCLMLLWQRVAATDELLSALAGPRGGNRASLCAAAPGPLEAGPSRCAGALWRGQWVLARASCLEHRFLYKMIVLRDADGISCESFQNGQELPGAAKVRVKFVHPEFGRSARGDLALLALDHRFWGLEPLSNTSTVHDLLDEYTPWMEEAHNQYYPRRISYAHKSSLFSTPLRMFMTTILLPSASFMILFIYVIFFTGPKDQIPYKSIKYEKQEESENSDKFESGDSPLGV